MTTTTLSVHRVAEPSATDGIYTNRPSKHLLEISPDPKILTAFNKRMKQSATILMSQELINRQKNRKVNTSGSKKPQTKAEHRKTPEESYKRKTIVMTATSAINFGKTVPRQYQNSENGYMNPVQRVGCF
jgi:post-segregation antitoxin (ccd killing protein)